MVEVLKNYKLAEVNVNGEIHSVEINTSEDVHTVMEVMTPNGMVEIHEGDKIQFISEMGIKCVGFLNKIKGKGEKTKFTFTPEGSECVEETWAVLNIKEGTLTTFSDTEEGED